ncbi:MAG: hypothetical protein R3F04_16235 [Lysobacteraceae bacterium]
MPPFFLVRFPRHPLLRWALALLGVALLVVFSVVGLVLFAVAVFAWSARMAWLRWRGVPSGAERFSAPRHSAASSDSTAAADAVIEGDFEVVEIHERADGAKRVQRIP